MVAQLRDFIAEQKWGDIAVLPFFLDGESAQVAHQEVIESVRAEFPNVLTTEVPYSAQVERMTLRRAPLPAYSPGSPEEKVYAALWQEVVARMGRP
jgi:chromosome partitioning protein